MISAADQLWVNLPQPTSQKRPSPPPLLIWESYSPDLEVRLSPPLLSHHFGQTKRSRVGRSDCFIFQKNQCPRQHKKRAARKPRRTTPLGESPCWGVARRLRAARHRALRRSPAARRLRASGIRGAGLWTAAAGRTGAARVHTPAARLATKTTSVSSAPRTIRSGVLPFRGVDFQRRQAQGEKHFVHCLHFQISDKTF